MCTICQHKYGKKLIAPTNAVKLKACLLCSFVRVLSPLHSPSHRGPPLSRQVDRFVRQCVRRLVVLSIDMPDGPRNASGLQHLPHLQAVRVIRQKCRAAACPFVSNLPREEHGIHFKYNLLIALSCCPLHAFKQARIFRDVVTDAPPEVPARLLERSSEPTTARSPVGSARSRDARVAPSVLATCSIRPVYCAGIVWRRWRFEARCPPFLLCRGVHAVY